MHRVLELLVSGLECHDQQCLRPFVDREEPYTHSYHCLVPALYNQKDVPNRYQLKRLNENGIGSHKGVYCLGVLI